MLNLNQLKKLYTNSPLWLKKLYASIPFEIRNGKDYRKWKMFLTQHVNPDEYELLKLKETVAYAYNNTVFYKQLFDKLKLTPNDINEKKDLALIPIIDKSIVRDRFEDFIAHTYPKSDSFWVTTGGSTGDPMQFFQSKNIWAKELAFYMYFFYKYKYKPSMIKASFRGGFTRTQDEIFWFYNPVNNEMMFSSSHINKENITKFINKLNEIKPRFFHGFASSMLFLMHNMEQMNLKLNFQLNAIFLVSESFTSNDIDQISSYFNCNVASTYGHSERLVLAESFGQSVVGYQINRHYGLFELIDVNNNTIDKNELRGEIIGTGFDNYAMPLLRYRTGDFTTYLDHDNRTIDLVESTRSQLYIDCKDGDKIAFPSLIKVSEMYQLGILKYQIHQSMPGQMKLLIVPSKNYDINKKEKLTKSLENRIHGRIDYEVVSTDQLNITNRGKCKLLIKEYE